MITSIDHVILLWIENHLRFAWMTPFWKMITLLGNGGIFWILVCLVMLCMKKTRKAGIVMSVALIINALLVNVCIKNFVARVRPYDAFDDIIRLIEVQRDYSFPSGHTMVSFAAATVLWHWNRKVGIAAYLLAAVIAFSRLYLFVHFPSDVFAGTVIGVLIGIAAIKGTDWMQKKFQKQKN